MLIVFRLRSIKGDASGNCSNPPDSPWLSLSLSLSFSLSLSLSLSLFLCLSHSLFLPLAPLSLSLSLPPSLPPSHSVLAGGLYSRRGRICCHISIFPWKGERHGKEFSLFRWVILRGPHVLTGVIYSSVWQLKRFAFWQRFCFCATMRIRVQRSTRSFHW